MGCHSVYSNPLIERYASKEMSYIFLMITNTVYGVNYGLHWQRQKKNWALT